MTFPIQAFEQNIRRLGLSSNSKVLVACSGGRDSMLLLAFSQRVFKDIAIAHINYALRGEESNKDEQCVKRYCESLGIPLHIHKVSSDIWAESKKSIQETAREIRYTYFEEIRQKLQFEYILTAHHQSDNTETVLFNLFRSPGLKGACGIQEKNGYIVRPLLYLNREQINQLVKDSQIEYRDDESNGTDKYNRNFIRNRILKPLSERFDAIDRHIYKWSKRMEEIHAFVIPFCHQYLTEKQTTTKSQISITIQDIMSFEMPQTLLFVWLKDYQFTSAQIEDIFNCLREKKLIGKDFFSVTHCLSFGRDRLYLQSKAVTSQAFENIELSQEELREGREISVQEATLRFTSMDETAFREKLKTINSSHALIDFSKIAFPLILRKWKEGDRFIPFGMHKFKKVSDFLVGEKVDKVEKNKVLILEDANGNIVWVVGFRQDERYRIDAPNATIIHLAIDKE